MSTPYTPSNGGKPIITPGSGGDSFSTESNLSRNLPRQMSTGSTRGTQTVGYGNVKIDGSNNRISLSANSTNITIGDTSNTDNQTGVSLTDNSNNNLVTIGRVSGEDSTTGLTIYDASNTRRLLGGLYPNGNIKIALSQPTYDVATATDDQLIWSSDFNLFKIAKSGTVSIPEVIVPAPDYLNGTTVSIDTGYAFKPEKIYLVQCYTENGTILPRILPNLDVNSAPISGGIYSLLTADATSSENGNVFLQINLIVYGGTNSDGGFDVKWFIVEETLN